MRLTNSLFLAATRNYNLLHIVLYTFTYLYIQSYTLLTSLL